MSEVKPARHQKVMRLRILKPSGEMTWKELAELLRGVRYRVFRLANLAISENYLNFHLYRTGKLNDFKTRNINQLNRDLRAMLLEEKETSEQADRYSKTGAVCDPVCGALAQFKLRAVTSKSKWKEVLTGKSSLPTFRLNMAIPVRCDDTPDFRVKGKTPKRRLERTESKDVELDLVICRKPYPRVVLATGKLHDGERAILDRLLENTDQQLDGYRQRCFEIKHDERTNIWWLNVTYDFPAHAERPKESGITVGVDFGYACPIYVALSNGHARLGWKHFSALGARIKQLQTQVIARRRQILRGGNSSLVSDSARSGHGRRRRLKPTEQLEGRIHNAYTTLNHQLSASVVKFAIDHGADRVQIEDLTGLNDVLSGSFLGARWRYHQLQQFLEYKCKEAGIHLVKVNPKYTSRRCSQCGFIHLGFNRAFRDAQRTSAGTTRFRCPECDYEVDPDYNAARNLSVRDIESIIASQLLKQPKPDGPARTEPLLFDKSHI